MAALLDAAPFAKDPPKKVTRKLTSQPVSKNWKAELLAGDEAVNMRWSDRASLGVSPPACSARLPDLPLAPGPVLEFLSELPIYLAVMPAHVPNWQDGGYRLPKVGAGHAGLGWAVAFKGPGHERHLVSRRWLEHGPFRIKTGANDTTLVQFCDLDVDPETALDQAKPGHEWMAAGFMIDQHQLDHDIEGLYTPKDGLLRIVINDREITDEELLDACVVRRERANDKKQPIKNIAYIFVDEQEARANLERLWQRGLECHIADGEGERRLDESCTPKQPNKPAWV